MERLLPIAEQLDRAAVELRLDHPIHNRLALILIDNAIELMARDSLWMHVHLGGDFHEVKAITAKHRKLARSQRLSDRLKVLVFVNELTRQEADFIVAAHQHRNAAYHEGIRREGFLRQLSFHYYEFACRYISRFEIGVYIHSINFQFTEIGRRYYEATRGSRRMLGEIDRGKLGEILLAQLPNPPDRSLQQALADDLEESRDGIASGFRFLIENTRPTQTWRYLLAKAQFEYSRDQALEKEGLDDTIWDTPRRKDAANFVVANRSKFGPRYRALPHGSWSQSIARVRLCPDAQASLVRFQRLRESMHFLREAVGLAVMRLEGELERD